MWIFYFLWIYDICLRCLKFDIISENTFIHLLNKYMVSSRNLQETYKKLRGCFHIFCIFLKNQSACFQFLSGGDAL